MTDAELTAAAKAQKAYKSAWIDVLIAILLTVINLFALFGDTYFLFSIYATTLLFAAGIILGNVETAAEAGFEVTAETAGFMMGIAIAIGLIVLTVYFVMFLLARKHGWAMIALSVLFCVDTVILLVDMLSALDYTMIIDLVIHIVFLVYLSSA